MNAPSAFSTASLSILPRSAASTIGTGSAGGRSSLKPVDVRSPENAARRNSSVCEILVSGLANGIWFQPSTIRSDEAPIPSTNLPSLASDRAAACWASSAGPRVKTPTTPVPSRTRSVQVAASASGVKPSGPWVSPLHRSVYPAASARRTSSACSRSGRLGSGSVRPQRAHARDPTARPWRSGLALG